MRVSEPPRSRTQGAGRAWADADGVLGTVDGGFVIAECEGRGDTRGACAASIIRFVTAQDRLRELSDFAAPWAVWIAATLRLPDHIEAGAARLEDLSDRARTDPDALMRLLRYLVARGVFAETAGRYENTELSRLLLDEGGQ